MERTVVLLKPDAVKRALVGEIISRLERVGLKIVALKMVWVDEALVSKHYPVSREEWVKQMGERTLKTYAEYGKDPNEELGTKDAMEIGKMVSKWLVEHLTSGPLVAILVEGNHAIKVVRKLAGSTSPFEAQPGTIRGDFSHDSADFANARGRPMQTVVHASGNPEEAKFEEELWFRKNEVHKYKRVDEELMFG